MNSVGQEPCDLVEKGELDAAHVEQAAFADNQPTNIAVISNEPTPYRLHVLSRMTLELAGVNVHCIFTHTLSKPTMPWQMRIQERIRPVFFQKHHLRFGQPISKHSIPLFKDISRYLEEQNIRLAVVLGYNDLTRALLIRWAKKRGLPMLMCADSNVFGEGAIPFHIRWIKRLYVRWVLRNLGGIMPMGTCGRAFFRLYQDHDLPEFLYPCEPDYAALARPADDAIEQFHQQFSLHRCRKRFLYCGRLVREKRVDLLLEAFAQAAMQRPDWDLVIAGDGPLRQELQRSVPPSIAHRVKWLGFLQFQQTVCCYYACDVLVHPSEYEPWGLVINEAVACRLPVIATSVVGAAVELVRNQFNGLIIPPRNLQAMIEALLEISSDDRYCAMREPNAIMLSSWRAAADPVDGIRQALAHFKLYSERGAPVKTTDLAQ